MNDITIGWVIMGVLAVAFAIVTLWGVYQFTKPFSVEEKK